MSDTVALAICSLALATGIGISALVFGLCFDHLQKRRLLRFVAFSVVSGLVGLGAGLWLSHKTSTPAIAKAANKEDGGRNANEYISGGHKRFGSPGEAMTAASVEINNSVKAAAIIATAYHDQLDQPLRFTPGDGLEYSLTSAGIDETFGTPDDVTMGYRFGR